jgi:alkylation response protein AidB-like acyl-CoA dehydrogenase
MNHITDPVLERDLLAAVARVRPIAEARARDSERDATLHPDVVAALRREGLFALGAPAELGGGGASGSTQLTVFEAMAHADSSAGWALMIGASISGMMGAYLPDATARELFAGHVPIAAGLQVPMGTARPVAGGYRVTGRWGFGSGIRHADWVFTAARVEAGTSDAPPCFVHVAVPVGQVTIEDTWDTSFLSGSGSEHYRLEDVFVDHAHTCDYPAAARQRGGAFFDLPFVALVAPGHLGFALGVAQRALDEAASLAPRRVMAWTGEPIAARSSFRAELGRHEVALQAARALAREVIARCTGRVAEGEPLSPADWAAVRGAVTYVTEVAVQVATFAFRAGGATALLAGAPLERCFRDSHAALAHIAATVDAYDYVGRVVLGEAPFHPMLMARSQPTAAAEARHAQSV